jgi:hypothetical protein
MNKFTSKNNILSVYSNHKPSLPASSKMVSSANESEKSRPPAPELIKSKFWSLIL